MIKGYERTASKSFVLNHLFFIHLDGVVKGVVHVLERG